jgi:hypothetical protein
MIFPRNSATIHDVKRAVFAAKEKYDRSPQSKARKWLSSCSKRVMYYGVIMDTLSQHHPEYVSLAWGALKFLFIVSHSSMVFLSQHLTSIPAGSDQLRRTASADIEDRVENSRCFASSRTCL